MVEMELVVDRKTEESVTVLTKRPVEACRQKGLIMKSAGTHSFINAIAGYGRTAGKGILNCRKRPRCG